MAVKFIYDGKGYTFFKHGYKNVANNATVGKGRGNAGKPLHGAEYLAAECRGLMQFVIVNYISGVKDIYTGVVLALSYMKSCYDALYKYAYAFASAHDMQIAIKGDSSYKGILDAYDSYVVNKKPLPKGDDAFAVHGELILAAAKAAAEIEGTIVADSDKIKASTIAGDIIAISKSIYNKAKAL